MYIIKIEMGFNDRVDLPLELGAVDSWRPDPPTHQQGLTPHLGSAWTYRWLPGICG